MHIKYKVNHGLYLQGYLQIRMLKDTFGCKKVT